MDNLTNQISVNYVSHYTNMGDTIIKDYERLKQQKLEPIDIFI